MILIYCDLILCISFGLVFYRRSLKQARKKHENHEQIVSTQRSSVDAVSFYIDLLMARTCVQTDLKTVKNQFDLLSVENFH